MYVFKTFELATPVPMTAKTAVDNGYELFINGVLAAGANAEGFTSHWEYTNLLPASLFRAGTNALAVHLEDHGGATAWDFALLGDDSGLRSVPETATLLLVGSGLAGLGALGWRRQRSQ